MADLATTVDESLYALALDAHEAHLYAETVKRLADEFADVEGSTDPDLQIRQHSLLTVLLAESAKLEELTGEMANALGARAGRSEEGGA